MCMSVTYTAVLSKVLIDTHTHKKTNKPPPPENNNKKLPQTNDKHILHRQSKESPLRNTEKTKVTTAEGQDHTPWWWGQGMGNRRISH